MSKYASVTATPFLSSSLFLIYEVLQDQSYQLKPHNFPHGSNRELVLLFWNKNKDFLFLLTVWALKLRIFLNLKWQEQEKSQKQSNKNELLF